MSMSTEMVRCLVKCVLWPGYLVSGVAGASDLDLPLWEAGLAGGVLSTPQYIGSDQRYTLPLGIPYLIYRGKFFKADRDGLRGELINGRKYSVDLGFSFGLPVNNSNRARQGMPDLYLSGQVGPRFNWLFTDDRDALQIGFHLPLRYSRDIKNNNLGWLVEPSLKVKRKNLGPESKLSLRTDTGLLFASRHYNQYFYGVDHAFATPGRPAYDAKSGLHSYFINFSGRYRTSTALSFGAFVRWKTMMNSIVSDSPLVKDRSYLVVGMGMTWVFNKSAHPAP